MKKLTIIKVGGLFLFLTLAIVLISCEKDPIVPEIYTIETQTSIGGTLLPLVGKIEVIEGNNQAVTAKPYNGYKFESMIVDGKNVTSILLNNTYNFNDVDSNHVVKATFKKIPVVMHNVEIIPTTDGTVSSSLTQVGDSLGITLTFSPNPGFKPDSVIINGKSYVLTGNSYFLEKVISDTKVKGVFKKTLSWYIMQGEWKRDSVIRRETPADPWIHSKMWGVPGVLQMAVTFLPTGRMIEYWNDVQVGDVPWSIDETSTIPTLNTGGWIWKIEKLDSNSLVLANYEVVCVTCPNPSDPSTFRATKNVYSHH